MAKSINEYRQEQERKLNEARLKNNALLNYIREPTKSAAKEEAKASSGGFDFGDYIAEAMQYAKAGPVGVGLLAGLTKPLWEDAVSDNFLNKLDNYVDRKTFLGRKMNEGAYKSIEGIVDLGAGLVGGVGGLISDDFRAGVKDFIANDHVGEWYNRDAYKHTENGIFKDDGLVAQGAEAVGGMLPSVLVAIATGGGSVAAQGAAKGVSALAKAAPLLTTATGAAGNATESAYQDGAGYYGGLAYGTAIGGLEAATEKLVGGGLEKAFGGGWLDDIIPIGDWAKTGVGRYVANAAGEGFEEMVSEAVDPLAKSIYKGKDAFTEYDFGEHMKNIVKAGLMGAAVSGVYGGAFDVMAGGVKAGDVDSLMRDVAVAETKGQNLQDSGKLDDATREKLKSQTLGDLQTVEKILKSLPESKRAEIIESRQLSDRFEADGSLKNTLDGDGNLEYNKNYISYTARGSAQKITDTLSDMSADVAEKYAKANNVDIETAKAQVGEFKIYNQELTENGNKTFTKFKKALSFLNKLGDSNVKFAVVEPNSSFNGALKDGVMYIGADTFENGKWAGTLVHEYMHFEEGTAEYNALVKHLESDNALLDSALASVSGKAYGFDGTKLDAIIEKASAGEDITADERRYYASFKGEVSAHMGELLLGSEAFIDTIVAKDGNIAQKAVAKIKSLKAMFERLGNAEASAEYKFLKKAEDLYLKAAEKAGDAQLIRYITSGEWDEEEAQYARKTVNVKKLPKVKKYIKIGEYEYNVIYKKVSALYSGISNGFADGIAIEDGNSIYIVDSGKDNGKLDFGVREKLIRSNSLSRSEYIRRTNNEAIRRGFVDDGLSGRIRDRLYNDRASDRRQDEGLQLQTTQGESQYNQGGVSSKNEEASKGIKYSLKDSDGKVLTPEQAEYFKDSKIRDENGNLLVVYHGTSETFDIFDFSKIGQNGKAEGYGFYFSDDPEITKRYGEIQKAVYLNITNPLSKTKRTMTRAQFAKLVSAVMDLEMSQYANEIPDWKDTFISNYVMTYDAEMTKQRAVQGFVNAVWDGCENDVDLVYEIANGSGQSYSTKTMREFYDVLTKTLGYDGIVAEWAHDDGISKVYVTFSSEQSKYTSNQYPTLNALMRYSLKDSDNNKNTALGNEKGQADNKKPAENRGKLFTHSASKQFMSDVLNEDIAIEGGTVSFEKKGETERAIYRLMNEALFAEDPKENIDKVAELILSRCNVTRDIETAPEDIKRHNATLEMLSPYLKSLDLSSIYDELETRYNEKALGVTMRIWECDGKHSEVALEKMFAELEEKGIKIKGRTLAEKFFSINEMQRKASMAVKAWKNKTLEQVLAKSEEAPRKVFEIEENSELAKRISSSKKEDAPTNYGVARPVGYALQNASSTNSISQNPEKSTPNSEKNIGEGINRKTIKDAIIKRITENYIQNDEFAGRKELLKMRKEMPEKIAERDRYNDYKNSVIEQLANIKKWDKGLFENASKFKSQALSGGVGQLADMLRGGKLLDSEICRKVIGKVHKWYSSKENIENGGVLEGYYKEPLAALMEQLAGGDGELTTAELGALSKVISGLKKLTEDYNKVYRNGKREDAMKIAQKAIRNTEENSKIRVPIIDKVMSSPFNEIFFEPMTLARWHDRYDNDGFYTTSMREFRKGLLDASYAVIELRRNLDKFCKEDKKYLGTLKEKVTVEDVEINRGQMISLYMTLKREQAHKALAIAGMSFSDEKGKLFEMMGLVEKQLQMGAVALEETTAAIGRFKNRLEALLTERDKKYIAIIEDIYEQCKERKRSADMLLLGFSNVMEGYYYPISRDHRSQSIDSAYEEFDRISKFSFNESTVHGSGGRLFIESVDKVLERHIGGIALYENISIPLENFNRLFNLNIGTNPNAPITIRTTSKRADVRGWVNADAYFKKIINDVYGKSTRNIGQLEKNINKAIGKIRSNVVKAWLGANIKVLGTQLSSYLAASSVIDWKYLLFNDISMVDGAELNKYSHIAEVRDYENVSALAQGVIEKIDSVGDWLMTPIGKMDRFVVRRLWSACQLQVEDQQGLERGTEGNKKAAAELLEKAIFETQQNAQLTERSAAMRADNELVRAIVMFTADLMKLTGRQIDAMGALWVTKKKIALAKSQGIDTKGLNAQLKTDRTNIRRTTVALIAANAWVAFVAQMINLLYGRLDDEDEKAKTMLKDFALDMGVSFLGAFPIHAKVAEFFVDGYDIENYFLSSVNDMLSATRKTADMFIGALSGEAITLQDGLSSAKDLAFGACQLGGLPLRNAYNLSRGLVGLVSDSAVYSWDSLFHDKSYRADLYKAIEAGDDKLVARISSLMVGESFDGVDKSVADELRRLVGTGADVLPRAVGDSITYDGEEYAFTLRQRNQFEKIYGIADEALADMVKLKQYKAADDEVKARAVKFIYETYYGLAVDDMLGVDSSAKNVLFAEAIDIEKLAIIVAQARMITADKDKNGKPINGTRKLKLVKFIESLSLKAAEKHMLLGFLGYRQKAGEEKVKAYINRLKLTSAEKKALLEFSGYKAA